MYRYVIVLYGRIDTKVMEQIANLLFSFGARTYARSDASSLVYEAKFEAENACDVQKLQEESRKIEGVSVAEVYEITDKEREDSLAKRKCAAE